MNKYKKIFLDGVIFSNPTFVLVLGTCPTLGLISSAMSAMSMGLCIIVILTLSNVLISAMRKVIPNEVRIPCYIVLIATLVTLLRMVLEKFLPDIYSATLALTCMGIVCEVLGSGSLFGAKLWDFSIALFAQPAGSFIIFGLSIALFTKVMDSVMGNARSKRQAEEARRAARRGAAAKEA